MRNKGTITLLEHNSDRIAALIHAIFQASYTEEARLVGLTDFPPLNRTVEHIQNSGTRIFGYIEAGQLVGLIELEAAPPKLVIASLAVHPHHFRKGIGHSLVAFALENSQWDVAEVQTAAANLPAIALYEKLGFVVEKRWSSKEGIALVQLGRNIIATVP